eukprot:Em0019g1204a
MHTRTRTHKLQICKFTSSPKSIRFQSFIAYTGLSRSHLTSNKMQASQCYRFAILYFFPLLLKYPLQARSTRGGGDSVTVGNLLVAAASFLRAFPDKDVVKHLDELVRLLGPLLLIHLLLLCTATSCHFQLF